MASEPVSRLEVERYRGVLSVELCDSERRIIEKLLNESKAQLAALDRNPIGLSGPAIGFLVPMTERDLLEQRIRQLEEGLRHLQRLGELGQVVSALLHELIQPHAAISNYIGAAECLLRVGDHQQVEQILKKIADQMARSKRIIAQVREFVR